MPDQVPCIERVLQAIRLEEADRVPSAELYVEPEVKSTFMGRPVRTLEDDVDFWRAAGYDYIALDADLYSTPQIQHSIATPIRGTAVAYGDHRQDRNWVASEARATTTWEQMESFPLPKADDVHLDPLQQVALYLPPGMGVLVTIGHVCTAAWQLMGFETFRLALLESLELACEMVRCSGEETLLLLELVLSHDLPMEGGDCMRRGRPSVATGQ